MQQWYHKYIHMFICKQNHIVYLCAPARNKTHMLIHLLYSIQEHFGNFKKSALEFFLDFFFAEWFTLLHMQCQTLCKCHHYSISLFQASSPVQMLLRDYCRVNYGDSVINTATLLSANLSLVAVLGVRPLQSPCRKQNNSETAWCCQLLMNILDQFPWQSRSKHPGSAGTQLCTVYLDVNWYIFIFFFLALYS